MANEIISELERITSEIEALRLHPAAPEDYVQGYAEGRNDAAYIVREAIDNMPGTEFPEVPTFQRPPLPPENGKTWEQVLALFASHNQSAPCWQLRDALVGILVWAQYGYAVSEAIHHPTPL